MLRDLIENIIWTSASFENNLEIMHTFANIQTNASSGQIIISPKINQKYLV